MSYQVPAIPDDVRKMSHSSRAWRNLPEEIRLWARVTVGHPEQCWLWTGPVATHNGYGRMSFGGRLAMTHRAAYQLAYGSIPAGQVVMHSCDTPHCCNPAHLSLGTQAANNADRDAKGRGHGSKITHCSQGHPYTPENTYVTPREGWRQCKTCRSARRKETYRTTGK